MLEGRKIFEKKTYNFFYQNLIINHTNFEIFKAVEKFNLISSVNFKASDECRLLFSFFHFGFKSFFFL